MRAQLLQLAPELARRLPSDQVNEAAQALTVATMELPTGAWDAPRSPRPGHLGFLILDGLLVREICISRDWSSELLGEGDLLRPWLEDSASFVQARWQVLQRTQLAILDASTALQIGRFPALIDELIERALRRGRSMAVHAVIEGVHRIEDRLLLLFWHMAELHGQREGGRIVVPIRLTHDHLARLVGARRPTVTTALGSLEDSGRISRLPDGSWIVAGDSPAPGSLS